MPDPTDPAATPEPGTPAGPPPDEVEEVLSAIRRLITQGAPPAARLGPVPPPAAPFVLTAEHRVPADPQASAPEPGLPAELPLAGLAPTASPEDLSEEPPAQPPPEPAIEPPGAEPLVLGPPLAPPAPAPALADTRREEPETPPAADAAPPPGAPSFLLLGHEAEGFVFGAAPFVPAAALQPEPEADPELASTGSEEVADATPVAAPILHDAPSDPPVVGAAPAEDQDRTPAADEAAASAPAVEGPALAEAPLPPLVLSAGSLAGDPLPTLRLPWEDPAAAPPPEPRADGRGPAAAEPDWPELRRADAPEADPSDAGLADALLSAARASLPDPGGPSATEPAASGLPDDLRAQIAELVREEVQKGLATLHEALRAELAPKPKAPRKKG